MQYLSPALMMVATLTLSAPAAHATPIPFTTLLLGANEVSPVNTPGVGLGLVILDPDAHTLQVNTVFGFLTSPTTVAHIHCCQPPGANAIVATTTPTFPGFPAGVTAGVYFSPVFDLTMTSSYNPAFITANGGTVETAEAALIAGMLGGLSYLNIHTEANTTLADLLTRLLSFDDGSSAVRALLRRRSGYEVEDGASDGGQAWLRRWPIDFFPASLL